jgi:hypothetical protein
VNDSKNYAARAKALGLIIAVGLLAIVATPVRAQTTTPPAETTPPATAPTEATPPAETTPPAEHVEETPAPTTTTPAAEPATTAPTTTPSVDPTTIAPPTESAPSTESAAASSSTSTESTSTNPDEAAEQIQTAREPLAWRNSYLNYSINSSFCTFSRDCQLSYNPNVYSWWSLAPRWYLDAETFFTFYQAFTQEHTDSDDATYAHEFTVWDTRVSLSHRFAVGDNFLILPGISTWLPLSKASQALQRYFRLGASISATWNPNVGGFNLSASVGYLRSFAGSNVPLTHSPYLASTLPSGTMTSTLPPSPGGGGNPAETANQANDATGDADRITTGITANWTPLEGFTITLQIFYIWINGFGLGTGIVPGTQTASGGAYALPADNSSHWRAYDSYSIYFQYDFIPWLQGWIGLSNSTQLAAVFNQDGSARSPVALFDMQASLGVTITLDGFYESFANAGEDDGLTPEQRQRRRQGLAANPAVGGTL